MHLRSIAGIVFALASAPQLAAASPLSDAAAALAEGEWVELPTESTDVLEFGEHTGNALPYSQSAAWDPVTDRLHYIGLDHAPGQEMHHFRFDAETNTWADLGLVAPAHGYEHIAIDPVSRTLYHRIYALGGIGDGAHRIIATNVDGPDDWTDLPPFPDSYAQVAIAMVWVPDLGLVVYNCGEENGQIAIRDPAGTWREIRGFGGTSRYSCFAEYSPARDVVVLGGGGGDDTRVWRMDRDGTVTELAASPISLGTSYVGSGLHQGNVAADPNTGDFLVLGDEFWSLDPTGTGTWRRLPDPTVGRIYGNNEMVSAPLTDHGVVVYVTCSAFDCGVSLYRHAPGSGMEVDVDAGTRTDAGTVAPGEDGGAPGRDAAGEPPPAAGCACRAAGAGSSAGGPSLAAIAILAWAWRRR